jgi:hypothetical protein
MIISNHAQRQMAIRGIGKPNVLAVLISGRNSTTEEEHITRHELEGLVVIMDNTTDTVVTAFHDRSGVKPKKPCTRHRTKKRTKWY